MAGRSVSFTNRLKHARSTGMVLKGFLRHEILMDRTEQMKQSCPCVPTWRMLCFTFIFFNLRSKFVDITVGPRPSYNYSADNMWVTAWPRLRVKYATRLVPMYSTDKEQYEMHEKRERMYVREGWEGEQYESKTGGISKKTGPYFLIFTVSASSPWLHEAWLAWGHSKWPGLE